MTMNWTHNLGVEIPDGEDFVDVHFGDPRSHTESGRAKFFNWTDENANDFVRGFRRHSVLLERCVGMAIHGVR